MNSFLIERRFGDVTEEDVASAGSRAKACAAAEFDNRLVWHQSLVHAGSEGLTTYCIYAAVDEETISEHAAAADLPCNKITPVAVVSPDDFV